MKDEVVSMQVRIMAIICSWRWNWELLSEDWMNKLFIASFCLLKNALQWSWWVCLIPKLQRFPLR